MQKKITIIAGLSVLLLLVSSMTSQAQTRDENVAVGETSAPGSLASNDIPPDLGAASDKDADNVRVNFPYSGTGLLLVSVLTGFGFVLFGLGLKIWRS